MGQHQKTKVKIKAAQQLTLSAWVTCLPQCNWITSLDSSCPVTITSELLGINVLSITMTSLGLLFIHWLISVSKWESQWCWDTASRRNPPTFSLQLLFPLLNNEHIHVIEVFRVAWGYSQQWVGFIPASMQWNRLGMTFQHVLSMHGGSLETWTDGECSCVETVSSTGIKFRMTVLFFYFFFLQTCLSKLIHFKSRAEENLHVFNEYDHHTEKNIQGFQRVQESRENDMRRVKKKKKKWQEADELSRPKIRT